MANGEESETWLRQGETLQRSTLIELFFDLAFVFAFTQLSITLVNDLSWGGAYRILLLTMAVWWTWSVTAWATDLYAQRAGLRALVIALMFGVLLLASAVPSAFGKQGLAFALSYVVLQMSRTSVLVIATWKHPLRKRPARVLSWFGISSIFWITGAFAHRGIRELLWSVAIAAEYGSANLGWPTPWLGRSALSEWDLVEEHLAERYRQILIIGLGDMILTIGLIYAADDPDALRTLAMAVSFITTVLFWQIYAYRAGERITIAFAPSSVRKARPARKLDWDHLIMIGGIVVAAVGTKLIIGHPAGHTPWTWIVVIMGGPALFLLGRAHFGWVVFGHHSWPRIIGLVVLGALVPVMKMLPPILVGAATALVLAGVISPDLPDLWRPAHFRPPNVRRKEARAAEEKAPPGRMAQPDA
jgi:low temperature requirement protein LtrA